MNATGNETISVEEARRRLRIGRNTAYQAIAAGEIPSFRIGRRILVPTAKLNALLGVGEGEACKCSKQ